METPINIAAEEMESIFGRRSKVHRSPVNSPLASGPSVEKEKEVRSIALDCTPAENNAETCENSTSSPRQEFILKMRLSEEEALEKCKKVLRQMRLAIGRQKNISRDVQNGVSEIEEILDIIGSYRKNWKAAEKQKQQSRPIIAETPTTSTNMSTPSTAQNKRSAPSPVEENPGKKKKDKAVEVKPPAKTAGKRKPDKEAEKKKPEEEARTSRRNPRRKPRARRPRKPRQRPEAVLIKPKEGHSYADVLRDLRRNAKPEEAEVAIRSVQKTRTGAVLLVMGRGGNKEVFCESLKGVLKEAAVVQDMKPKATIEIRDLDSLSTADEITEAVIKATGTTAGEVTVQLTALNSKEQRRAFVSLPTSCVNILLKTSRLLIGMTNCRLNYRDERKRCFRCFGAGHLQWECKGPDRKGMGLCIRCGESGHKMKECHNPRKCCICSQRGKGPTDHLPGSERCKGGKQQAC